MAHPAVHGAWQLQTYQVEVQSSGETFAPMGEHPTGYVIFTAEGRLSFTLAAEGRQPAETVAERAALPLNTVKARYYRGLARMREILERELRKERT